MQTTTKKTATKAEYLELLEQVRPAIEGAYYARRLDGRAMRYIYADIEALRARMGKLPELDLLPEGAFQQLFEEIRGIEHRIAYQVVFALDLDVKQRVNAEIMGFTMEKIPQLIRAEKGSRMSLKAISIRGKAFQDRVIFEAAGLRLISGIAQNAQNGLCAPDLPRAS